MSERIDSKTAANTIMSMCLDYLQGGITEKTFISNTLMFGECMNGTYLEFQDNTEGEEKICGLAEDFAKNVEDEVYRDAAEQGYFSGFKAGVKYIRRTNK